MIRTVAKAVLVLLILFGLFVGAVAGYVMFVVRHVSTGKPIERFPDARSALLVIDIQENYSGPGSKSGFSGAPAMIDKVNRLIERAENASWTVVFIGQEFPDNPLFRLLSDRLTVAGCAGTQMDPRLKMGTHRYFPKSVGDAFSNPDLETFLAGDRVNRLTLVGLDAEQCVYLTGKGARNRGFDVQVVRDAVITRSKRTMDQVMEDFTRMGASVTTTDILFAKELAPPAPAPQPAPVPDGASTR